MDRILARTRMVARVGLWFGGGLILLAAVLIGIDVVLRKAVSRSIGGADELAGYALAIGTAWALAAALIERAHIRVDSLYGLFPVLVRSILDLAGLALFVLFFALVGWHGLSVVEQSWVSGSRSQSALETPIVLPQAVWIVGIAFFLVVGVLLIVQGVLQLVRGEFAALAHTIGTRSAAEDLEAELESARARQALDGER